MIKLTDITKTYHGSGGTFIALDNINLYLAKGTHSAVVGKSGSGKSTLLNMLTGIDHPDYGAVVIDGVHPHELDESALATWRGTNIGIVFQFFQLIPTLSIRENLLLAMHFVDVVPAAERDQRIDTLLQQVGVEKHADKFPAALSGGEQQRAAIAHALVNDPSILVADEPTGNLDSRNAAEIRAIFKRLVEVGKTVVVVTHEEVAEAGYDRVIHLRDGCLIDSDAKGGVA